MADIAAQAHEQITELAGLVGELQERLKQTPVPRKLSDALKNFHTQYVAYSKAYSAGDREAIFGHTKNVALFARVISHNLTRAQGLDDQTKGLGKSIGQIGTTLRKVEDDPSTYQLLGELPTLRPPPSPELPAAALRRLEELVVEQEKQDERVKNRLADNDRRLAAISEALSGVESEAREALTRISDEHQKTLAELQAKKDQIDAILGHASGRLIAGDFETSARSEKLAADWLRAGSLLCMAAIVAMLGYSFWETVRADFDWHRSLFRVILAFLISAPAAYLARESTKHRAQQYVHLQTALDLKAIAPYLASLPEDVQHRIKAEIAGKLFAGRDLSHVTSESYPINAQEVLMKLVDKLGTQNEAEASKGKDKSTQGSNA